MRYKLLALLVFFSCGLQAQQINPVPDYVFANRMSVGRNAVTDTLAYFSIGPRYGAIRGFMPPMVVDTALVTGGTKRNGLTIFSIQKNKYMYWDSVRVQWSDFAGSSGAYIFATDTATMLNPYTRGSGTTNYLPKFTGSRTFGNSQIYDNGTNIGIGTTSPQQKLHIVTTGSNTAYFAASNGNTTTELLLGASADGDLNLYNPNSKNIRLYTSAVERMRIDASGNAGIGTTSPSSYSNLTTLTINGTNGSVIDMKTGNTLNGELYALSNEFRIDGVTGLLTFLTSSTERMRLTSAGEFLIGTTTDAGAYALQVAGAIYNTTGAVLAASSGNVGIGLSNPQAKLVVRSMTDGNLEFRPASEWNVSYTGVFLDALSDSRGSVADFVMRAKNITFAGFSTTPMIFATNNSERMRIASTGELLINTSTVTSGGYNLQVAGGIYNTTGAVFAASSGNVGVGTASASEKLEVNGNIKLGNNIYINSNGSVYNGNRLFINMGTSGTARMYASSDTAQVQFYVKDSINALKINADEEVFINPPLFSSDYGNYKLQVLGHVYFDSTLTVKQIDSTATAINILYGDADGVIKKARGPLSIQTDTPSGGASKPWKLGEAATVSPTSPNRTIRVEIDGTVYYIHAKTTND